MSAKTAPKTAAKTAPKTEAKAKTERGPSKQSVAMQAEIRKFMRKGKPYTSREVVEGLGRTPGAKEGGPVVRELKRMEEAGEVKHANDEDYGGYVWVR